jgi:hypothetical protein
MKGRYGMQNYVRLAESTATSDLDLTLGSLPVSAPATCKAVNLSCFQDRSRPQGSPCQKNCLVNDITFSGHYGEKA